MQIKAEARKRGRMIRENMPDQQRATFDAQIIARCRADIDWPHTGRVMAFMPIERRREIETRPLWSWIAEAHPEIMFYLPRLADDTLEAVEVAPETELAVNGWGIPEPTHGNVLDHHEVLDLVLTPLLAFDEAGNRVGYGRGFYDRFFARYEVKQKIGLGYDEQLIIGGIQTEKFDVALDAVVTQSGLRPFGH